MEVILLQRINKLGGLGDIVRVKDGFARNYLLPQKKALRATAENKSVFDSQRAELEVENKKQKAEAETAAKKVDNVSVVIVRQASEDGRLYGSVGPRDIEVALADKGFTIDRKAIAINETIKNTGTYPVRVILHSEVEVTVNLIIRTTELAPEEEVEVRPAAQAAAEEKPRRAPKPTSNEDTGEEEDEAA